MLVLHGLQPRRDVTTAVDVVQLVGYQQGGDVLAQQGQHTRIGWREAARLNHKQNQIHIGDRTLHGLVQRLIQCVGVQGLETGSVHKHKLRGTARVHAGDAVACGLGLARGDADFLAHQGVEQRGLADIGLADDGYQPAALAFCLCTRLRQFGRAFEQAFEHAVQIRLRAIYVISPRGI